MINWNTAWSKMWLPTTRRLGQPVHLKDTITQGIHGPASAKEAWELIGEHWNTEVLGERKALISIESGGSLFDDGRASHWTFEVDLLDRCAKAVVTWSLIWDGVSGKWVAIHMDLSVSPYPALGSPIHRIVALGHGTPHLLDGAWKQMREQSVDISDDFIDTPFVFQQMIQSGHSIQAARTQLWTGLYGGEKYWVVKHHDHTHFMPLEMHQHPHSDVVQRDKQLQDILD